jgi:hypothetical protein
MKNTSDPLVAEALAPGDRRVAEAIVLWTAGI